MKAQILFEESSLSVPPPEPEGDRGERIDFVKADGQKYVIN